MKEAIRLSRCLDIIRSYSRQEPLSIHLKRYFAKHKQMGSNDRRISRDLVYPFYRLGKACSSEDMEIRIALAAFIFREQADEMNRFLFPRYLKTNPPSGPTTPLQRFGIVQQLFPALARTDLFPFTGHLSAGLNRDDFLNALFERPLVWIRMKKKAKDEVMRDLNASGLSPVSTPLSDLALGFEPESHLTALVSYRKGLFEIQDLSSQLSAAYAEVQHETESWWDCCAGSGGKSLLMLDHHPSVTLTVSDIRQSVLDNLSGRFLKSGHRQVEYRVLDLTRSLVAPQKFDGILLDVPCSGSGTWNRTPEMLTNFDESGIAGYAIRQKKILENIRSCLNPGGKIIYITCSVFREENEEVISFAKDELGFGCSQQAILPGFSYRGDTLFAAKLEKI